MKAGLILGLPLLALVSCQGPVTVPFHPEAKHDLAGREVVLLNRGRSAFVATTPVNGLLGFGVDTHTGEGILGKRQDYDPARVIAEAIRKDLNARFGTRSGTFEVFTRETHTKDICANNFPADLILDVRTLEWTLNPVMWHPGRYEIRYSAFISLIDNKARRVVAECAVGYKTQHADGPEAAFFLETYTSGNGKLAWEEFHEATATCIKAFWTRTLATPS